MAGTSLAEQLKKLAAPQTSILVHSKKRISLLFDPKDAADIGREKFYEIGLSGLEELKTIEPRLAEYEKSLFDETSLHLERAVEDHQANAKLDQMIHKFLMLLSPYLNLKGTHRALEWLIQRFHIHQYNVDSIMALILPYHDTNIFARMVQLLSLNSKGGRWIWLKPLKKEGIPMSKLFLLSRASTDLVFLKFVCNLPLLAIKAHGEKSHCLTVLLAFYCTTVIGALDQTPQVSEVHVTHILPSLIAGIDSPNIDFTASVFMILGHLVSKVRLTHGIFSKLFYKVAKSNGPVLRNEAALVLVVMAQSVQMPSVLPAILHLADVEWFLPSLNNIATSGVVVFPLIAVLIHNCLTALKNTENTQLENLQTFVLKLLEQLSFNNDEANALFKLFSDNALPGNKWFHDVLHQLEKSYPEAFDASVKSNSNLLGLLPDRMARNSLFQRLIHPEAKVRFEALVYIKSQKELLQEEWVHDTLADRLSDDNARVVAAVLDLVGSVPRRKLGDKLIGVAARCWHATGSLYTLGPVVLNHLLDIDNSSSTILLLTLPFFLPSTQKQLAVSKDVLNCDVVKKTKIFHSLSKELQKNEMTEEFLAKQVHIFLQKQIKCVSMEDMLCASQLLEPYGTVYQFIAMLCVAATLPDQLTSENLMPLLQCLTQYNRSTHISTESPDMLTENNLTSIVSLCRSNKLPFQGSLYLLVAIINKLKCSLPKEKLINVKEPSAAPVVDVLRIVLQMKNSKNKYIRQAYSAVCNEMFQKYCGEVGDQIDLISNLVLGCPDIAAQCMKILKSLVDESDSVREQVLVPALLVALSSEDNKTRYNALAMLNSLSQKLALPTYHKLIDHLIQHSEEITIDPEQINVALYLCLSPDPSVQSLMNKSQRQDMANILNSLIGVIVASDTPSYVKSSLLKIIDQVNSKSLLESLIPLAMNILLSKERSVDDLTVLQAVVRRFNVTTSSAFNDDRVWTFTEVCLKDHKSHSNEGPLPTVLILNQIDQDLFAALNMTQQERLLSLVVSCVVETEMSEVSNATASFFKRILLDGAIVAKLLEPMRDVTIDTPSEKTKKRGWTVKKPPPLELLTSAAWKQGLYLLEFVQTKKKLDNVKILIPRLFEILNRCLQFEEQSPVEYTKQVLLTSLLHCCAKLSSGSGAVDLPESSIQVELVVECIRISSNPQTHHHALLLLAHIASMIPDGVLHCIMPIFTFMGSSVLRQDDAYSFQIISKIVETIVPILVMNDKDNQELSTEVVGVLRVFADALLDIPEHRRIPLFTKLLTTLQDGRFLWVFLTLVFENHILHPSPDNTVGRESGSIPKRLEVGLQLCHQFLPASVLFTAHRLIHYLCQLPLDKGDKKLQSFKKSNLGALFNVERATDKQLRHYSYTGLTFISLLLSSKQFLRLVATLKTEEVHDLKDTFEQLFEGILTLTQLISKQVDVSAGQPTVKYWKSMFNICFDVLTKINALLPGDMFLGVIMSLMDHELPMLRVKALELLNWRLQQGQPMDADQLMGLLPTLLNLVKHGDSTITEKQLIQQTALLSLKFLARQLATDHPQEFQQVLKNVTKLVKKINVKDPVLVSAVLCIGELCHTLGAHAIASLPSFMPPLISILQHNRLVGSGDLLLLSVVSALLKIVDSLACFLSPYLDKLLQQLCILSADCSQQSDKHKVQPILQKIKSIRLKISSDVPLRTLLPAVKESYSQLVAASQTNAVVWLLSLLGESFKTGHDLSPELTTFFLSTLDFRSSFASSADIELVEPAVISAIIALILKLSESSFRPFYYKIFNWAFQNNAHKDRSITFYKLTCCIAESLKGLFVSFAHYFLKNAAMLLDENNKSKNELKWDEEKGVELVEVVLKALYTVFLHDASHFVNKERFETIMQPVVDQLNNDLGGEEEMQKRAAEFVIPCLTHMAVSAADDTLWKQLNYQVLLKTRDNHPQVRIGGVLSVCEIAKKLGEEFLPLLPETVPFLAELLEDEDENVEKITRRVVQELESALGEPISKYF